MFYAGRTMDFTFDLSQTPVIGRRFLVKADEKGPNGGAASSPRRSLSLSPADNASIAGWKRPWMSQVQVSLMIMYMKCGNIHNKTVHTVVGSLVGVGKE
jgi:hypothetical protein